MVYPVISAGIIPEIEARRGGAPPLNRYEKYKDSITKAGIENKNDTDVHVGSWQIGGAVH